MMTLFDVGLKSEVKPAKQRVEVDRVTRGRAAAYVGSEMG